MIISTARQRDPAGIHRVGTAGSAVPTRPARWRGSLVGGAAIAGGALAAVGALLPWLSVYAGLKTYRGIAGLNGWLLFAGGLISVLMGALYVFIPRTLLRWAIGLFGALLFGFGCWIVVQLLALYREIGGNPFVVGRLGPGLFVSTLGGAIVLATLLLPAERPQSVRGADSAEPAVVPLALLSAAAAIVHFGVLGEHMREYWLSGLFFAVAGLLQMAWALAVSDRPSPRLLAVGAAGNTMIIAIWVVSRTVGMPLGPQAGTAESVGFPDALTTLYEACVVAGCLALLGWPGLWRASRARAGRIAAWAVAVAILPLTLAALLVATNATAIVPQL
jgi:hypothetical protein